MNRKNGKEISSIALTAVLVILVFGIFAVSSSARPIHVPSSGDVNDTTQIMQAINNLSAFDNESVRFHVREVHERVVREHNVSERRVPERSEGPHVRVHEQRNATREQVKYEPARTETKGNRDRAMNMSVVSEARPREPTRTDVKPPHNKTAEQIAHITAEKPVREPLKVEKFNGTAINRTAIERTIKQRLEAEAKPERLAAIPVRPDRESRIHNTIYVELGNSVTYTGAVINDDIVVRTGGKLTLINTDVNGDIDVYDHAKLEMDNSEVNSLYVYQFSSANLIAGSTVNNESGVWDSSSISASDSYLGDDWFGVFELSSASIQNCHVATDFVVMSNSSATIDGLTFTDSGTDNVIYVDCYSTATANDVTMVGIDNHLVAFDIAQLDVTNLDVTGDGIYIFPVYDGTVNIDGAVVAVSDYVYIDPFYKGFSTIRNAEIDCNYFEVASWEWAEVTLENVSVDADDYWWFYGYDGTWTTVIDSDFNAYGWSGSGIEQYYMSYFTARDSSFTADYNISMYAEYGGWISFDPCTIKSNDEYVYIYPVSGGWINFTDCSIEAYYDIDVVPYDGGWADFDACTLTSGEDLYLDIEDGAWANFRDCTIDAGDEVDIYEYEGGDLTFDGCDIDADYVYGEQEDGAWIDFTNCTIQLTSDFDVCQTCGGAWLDIDNCVITTLSGYFGLYPEDYGHWINITDTSITADDYIEINTSEDLWLMVDNCTFESGTSYIDFYLEEGVVASFSDSTFDAPFDYVEFYGYDGVVMTIDNCTVNSNETYFDACDYGVRMDISDTNVDTGYLYIDYYGGGVGVIDNCVFHSDGDFDFYADSGGAVNMSDTSIYAGDYGYMDFYDGGVGYFDHCDIVFEHDGDLYAYEGGYVEMTESTLNLNKDLTDSPAGGLYAGYGGWIKAQNVTIGGLDAKYGGYMELTNVTLTEGWIYMYEGAEIHIDGLTEPGTQEDGYVYGDEGCIFDLKNGEIKLTTDDFEFFDGADITLENVDITGDDGYWIDLECGIRVNGSELDINLENGSFYIDNGALINITDSEIDIGDDASENLWIERGVEATFTGTTIDDPVRANGSGASKVTFDTCTINGDVSTDDANEITLKDTTVSGGAYIYEGGWSPTGGTFTIDGSTLGDTMYAAGGPTVTVIGSTVTIEPDPGASTNASSSIYSLNALSSSTVTLDGTNNPFVVYNRYNDGTSTITDVGTIYDHVPVPAEVIAGQGWIYVPPGTTLTYNSNTVINNASIWVDNATLEVDGCTLSLTNATYHDIVIDNESVFNITDGSVLSSGDITVRDSSSMTMDNASTNMSTAIWFGSMLTMTDSSIDNDVYVYVDSDIAMGSTIERLYVYDHSRAVIANATVSDYFELYGFSTATVSENSSLESSWWGGWPYIDGFADFTATDSYLDNLFIDDGSTAYIENCTVDNYFAAGYYIPGIVIDGLTFTNTGTDNGIDLFYDCTVDAANVTMVGTDNWIYVYDIGKLDVTGLNVTGTDLWVEAFCVGDINIDGAIITVSDEVDIDGDYIGRVMLKNAEIECDDFGTYPYYIGWTMLENVNVNATYSWDFEPYNLGWLTVADSDFNSTGTGTCDIYPDYASWITITDTNMFSAYEIGLDPEDYGVISIDNCTLEVNRTAGDGEIDLWDGYYAGWVTITNSTIHSDGDIHSDVYGYGVLNITNCDLIADDSCIELEGDYAGWINVEDSRLYSGDYTGIYLYYGGFAVLDNCTINASRVDLYPEDTSTLKVRDCSITSRTGDVYIEAEDGSILDIDPCNIHSAEYIEIDSYHGSYMSIYDTQISADDYVDIEAYDGGYLTIENCDITSGDYLDIYAEYGGYVDITDTPMFVEDYIYIGVHELGDTDIDNCMLISNSSYVEFYAEEGCCLDVKDTPISGHTEVGFFYDCLSIGSIENSDITCDEFYIYAEDGGLLDFKDCTVTGNYSDIWYVYGGIGTFENVSIVMEDEGHMSAYEGGWIEMTDCTVNLDNDRTGNCGWLDARSGGWIWSQNVVTGKLLAWDGGYMNLSNVTLTDGEIGVYEGSELHIYGLEETGPLADGSLDAWHGATAEIRDGELNITDKWLYGDYGFDITLENVDITGYNGSYIELYGGGQFSARNCNIDLGPTGYFDAYTGVTVNLENTYINTSADTVHFGYGAYAEITDETIDDPVVIEYGCEVLFDNCTLNHNLTTCCGSETTLKESTIAGEIHANNGGILTVGDSTLGDVIYVSENTSVKLLRQTATIEPDASSGTMYFLYLYDPTTTVTLDGTSSPLYIHNLYNHCNESTVIITGDVTIVKWTTGGITVTVEDAKEEPVKGIRVIIEKTAPTELVFDSSTDWFGMTTLVDPEPGIYDVTAYIDGTQTKRVTYTGWCCDVLFGEDIPVVPDPVRVPAVTPIGMIGLVGLLGLIGAGIISRRR